MNAWFQPVVAETPTVKDSPLQCAVSEDAIASGTSQLREDSVGLLLVGFWLEWGLGVVFCGLVWLVWLVWWT